MDERFDRMMQFHSALRGLPNDVDPDAPIELLLGALALFVAEIHVASDMDVEGWVGLLRRYVAIRQASQAH